MRRGPSHVLRCFCCGRRISEDTGEVTMLDVLMSRQTMSEPEEWESQPFCEACSDPDHDDYLKDEAVDRRRNERLGL